MLMNFKKEKKKWEWAMIAKLLWMKRWHKEDGLDGLRYCDSDNARIRTPNYPLHGTYEVRYALWYRYGNITTFSKFLISA
jgi:hypothetical protein